ncbi:MAG: alpha/beta fold hydrolase [Candidatus Binatia bacterium]
MRIELARHALEVESSGAPPPDFLCLHGLADTRRIWSGIAPGLATRGRVETIDQRGHGGSGAPPGPYRREDLAADAISVLDRLGVPRAVLVGHSMGGIVAMTAALAFPERVAALVLLGTASECNARAARWYDEIAEAAEARGLDGLREAIFGVRSRRTLEGDAAAIAGVTRCLRSLHDDPLTPRLREVRCPVLLLVGSKDPMGAGASAILSRAFPSATLEVVPERGHWLHVECPETVLAAIDRFVSTHAAVLGNRGASRV